MRQTGRFRARSVGWPPRRLAFAGTLAALLLLGAIVTEYTTDGALLSSALRGGARYVSSGRTLSGGGNVFSPKPISGRLEKRFALTLEATVPELNEVYFQRMKDGGLGIFATGSLDGYPDVQGTAADVASRYLLAAFGDVPGVTVDFASLYLSYHNRYVMAAGLGRTEARQIALSTFAPDQGTALAGILARKDVYTGAFQGQAYAEFSTSK